jgi:serine phosphatase RsbU (regulator of sigma subunit)/Tfp pilus assembly protein PilF
VKFIPILRFCIISFLLLILGFNSKGQNRLIDSLQQLVNSPVDSLKVDGHNGLGTVFLQKDPPKAKIEIQKALALAKKINYKNGEATAYLLTGGYYFFTNNIDSALTYNTKAIDVFTANHNFKKHAAVYIKRGHMYSRIGKFTEALDAFNSSFEWGKKIRDTSSMAGALASMANIRAQKGEMNEAMKAYLQALKYYERIGDNWGTIVALNNIANIYGFQLQYQKAAESYQKVLELCIAEKRMEGIVGALDNLGATYIQLKDFKKGEKYLKMSYDSINKHPNDAYSKGLICLHLAVLYHYQSDLKKAEPFYFEAEKIYKAEQDEHGLTGLYTNMAIMYQENGLYKKAIGMLLKNEKLIREMDMRPSLKEVYANLSNTYALMKDFENAYVYANKGSRLKDTLYGESANEKIAEMEAIYQNDKKQKEIELKNSELSKKESEIRGQCLVKLLYGGGAIALLIGGILLLRGYREKRKANDLLTQQKEEIILAKSIIEEKNKDITDSIQYAKRLQFAVLPEVNVLSNLFNGAFILFRPKDIVSGDFYWVEKLGNFVVVATGDCTGHGVPGAFMSILGSNLLTQIVVEQGVRNSAEILRTLDKRVSHALNKKAAGGEYNDGMDIAICVFNMEKNTVSFAGANRPLLLKRGNELMEKKANKFAIGGIQDDSCKLFGAHEIHLQPNDKLYMFTDGYCDQFGGEDGKKFKFKRFSELLLKIGDDEMSEQKQILSDTLDNWKGELEQIDDVCVVGIRI